MDLGSGASWWGGLSPGSMNDVVPCCVVTLPCRTQWDRENSMTGDTSTAVEMGNNSLLDAGFVADLRRQMLKFATLQLSDAHAAEDAVQEALIGAMKNVQSFGGRSALKTWVFAILRNKIADILRQRQRMIPVSSLFNDDDEEGDKRIETLFDTKGFWLASERPVAWGNPEQSMNDKHFWRVFETCLEHLPPKQARVFMMREFIELDSEEICKSLGLSVSNLHVILHRARLKLRECLENNWFVEGECPC